MPVVVARLIATVHTIRPRLATALERTNANAVPGDLALAARRRRETKLLAAVRCPRARPAPADRPPPTRSARRRTGGRPDCRSAGVRAPRKRQVGVVGVDRGWFSPSVTSSPSAPLVGEKLGQIVAGAWPANWMKPTAKANRAKMLDTTATAPAGRRGSAAAPRRAKHGKSDDDSDKQKRQNQHEPGCGGAARMIDLRGGGCRSIIDR